MSWLSSAIGGFLDGVGDVLSGTGDVIAGVFTLDGSRIASGFNQALGGSLDMVTFGGYSRAVDYFKDMLTPDTPEQTFQGRKVMATGSDTPRQVVYGRARVSEQLVFIESTGNDSELLWMVVVLASHPCEGIDDIYLNDDLAFDDSSAFSGGFSDDPVGRFSDSGIQIWKRPQGGDPPLAVRLNVTNWTSDHRLEGLAYVIVRLKYDRDEFSRGVPSVSAVVRGRSIKDPRDGSVYYSNNHAMAVLDYLQSDQGFRVTDDEIDTESFIQAADISDQSVPGISILSEDRSADRNNPWRWEYSTGDTEPRYHVNGTVSLAASPVDNLNSLARAGAALVTYSQGKFRIIPGAYSDPVAEFDESDLVGGIKFSTGPGKRNATNVMRGEYIEPRQGWEPVGYPEAREQSYIDLDGEELSSEYMTPFSTSPALSKRLAKIAIRSERFGVNAQVTLKYTAAIVDVGDRITLTIAKLGWSQRVFRVIDSRLTIGQGVSLTLQEDGPSVWDWGVGDVEDVEQPVAVDLPNFGTILAPLNFTVTESLYTTNPRNDIKTRINLTWDSASSAGRLYDIQFRRFGDTEWVDEVSNLQGTEWFIADFELGQFEFRIRSKVATGSGHASDWVLVVFDVQGKQAPPARPSTLSAVQRSYGIDVEWTAVDELDVLLYELRLDENFGGPGAIYSGRQTSFQDVRRVSGVTYYVRALDTSGNYSDESTEITPTIGTPMAVSSVNASSIDNNVLLRWSTSQSVYPVAYYTIRRGQSFGTANTVGESSGTFEAIIEEASGTFRYWVQPVDAAGQTGPAVGAFASVDSPPDYILRADDFVDFEQMDLTNVAIGFGGGGENWDDTSLSWDGETLRWDDGPSLDLIGPVDTTESFLDNMGRSGLTTDPDQYWDETTQAWDDEALAWDSLGGDPYGDKLAAGYDHFLEPALLTGEAERIIDFGALIPTTRVTIFMDDEELIPGASVIIKMSTSQDGVTWTEFGDNQTEFSASNFQFIRINLSFQSNGFGLLRVNSIRFRLDIKQKTDQGRADVFAADVDGTTVLLNKDFIDIDSVTATPKAVDAKIAVTQFEDVGNQDRFSVYVFDRATGDRVDATINWIARGS